MREERSFIKKKDLIIIFIIMAFAMLGLFFIKLSQSNNKDAVIAQIYVDGEIYKEVELYDDMPDQNIYLEDHMNVNIKASNGQIWFEHSDCPDKLCIKSGRLSSHLNNAACLPANVAIVIE